MVELLKDEFSTNDTPLAAHLITEGYPLKDILFDGRKAYFIFSKELDGLEDTAHKFTLLNATSSNAARLIENFRQLITRSKRGY
jgi:hypothetical protein